MNSCIIRIGSAADAAMIAEFSRRSFYNAFSPFNTIENMDRFMQYEFGQDKLKAQAGEPGSVFLLAYIGSELSGYARLLESSIPPELGQTNAIEISRIYVENKITSKGIGSVLMQKCIDIAGEKNKQVLWLGVWEQNHRAIAFYRRFGFERFGDHIFMLGDDAQTDLLMKKDL